jgi:hypothetical protein
MALDDVASRLGYVLIVALVVGAGVSVATGTSGSAATADPLEVASHQPNAILADRAPETGELSLPGDIPSKHVVVDAAHGNTVQRSAVGPMIGALTEQGHTVSFYRGGRETTLNATLRSADAFVALSPQQSYTASERAGLEAFAEAGGRVLLAGEPPSQTMSVASILGVPQSSSQGAMNGLASSFGFSLGDGYLYDLERYDVNYRSVYATPTSSASLAPETTEVTVHEATTVRGGTPILHTIETAKPTTDRESGHHAVAARDGDVVVLGDASLLDSEWTARNDNEVFVSGLLEFLVTGDKTPGAPAPTESGSSPRRPRMG